MFFMWLLHYMLRHEQNGRHISDSMFLSHNVFMLFYAGSSVSWDPIGIELALVRAIPKRGLVQ